MTIGFKPQNFTRQPIYGEQVARKVATCNTMRVGYVLRSNRP